MEKENIEKILNKLGAGDVPTDVHKIAEEAARGFSETLIQKRHLRHYVLWNYITKRPITKLAVAATIIIAFGAGFSIGQRSQSTQLTTHSLDVPGYTMAVSMYPTTQKAEDSFWRQKTIAVMQPRPYAQTQNIKTSLLNTYKQYLKEKYYD